MRVCLRRLVVALMLSMPMSVGALPAQGGGQFADWASVVGQLRVIGIDASFVNWKPIEPACLPLRSTQGEEAYNRCKFEKARDSVQHKADRNYCATQARVDYPKGYVVEQGSNMRHPQPVSEAVLRGLRRDAEIACMGGLGWNSPTDWMLGKR